jgi:hypothetical protein
MKPSRVVINVRCDDEFVHLRLRDQPFEARLHGGWTAHDREAKRVFHAELLLRCPQLAHVVHGRLQQQRTSAP